MHGSKPYLGKKSIIIMSANADVSQDTIKGSLSFVEKNYNFTGKDLRYNFENVKNDKPDSGYENTVTNINAGTKFEQYEGIRSDNTKCYL